jgi:RNA polymerase primary sigma factor
MREVNKFSGSPLPRTALETEARVLALRAFDNYDPAKAQLSTHVTNHLKHLQRYVLTYQNIGRIPEHRGIAIGKFQTVKENLMEDLNREPTIVELADALQWSPAEVERMQTELRRDLNIMTREEDREELGGFFDYSIQDRPDPLKEAIQLVYFDSSPEDKLILEYAFGINRKQILSPKEIGRKIGRSEEYVRQKFLRLAREIQNARL